MKKEKVDDYFKQIKQAAIDGKLVFFVGAGVSALSGYPGWKGLVYEFEKGVEGKDVKPRYYASDEYLRIPQKYYVSKGKRKYNEILREFFDEEHNYNDIHEMMVELNPAHFITTNYDKLIEKACLKKYKNFRSISCDQGVAKASSSNYVLKVHGEFSEIIDGKDIVLKEDDYIDYDADYPLINNLAKSLVATNTVVFIGYGLNDYNINQMLNWVKRIQKNDFSHYFVRVDYVPLNKAEIKYYEQKGMNIIDVTRLIKTDKDDYFLRYKYFMEKLINEGKWDKIVDLRSSLLFIDERLSRLDAFNYIRRADLKVIFDNDYTFYPSGKIHRNKVCKYDYFKEYFDYKNGEYKDEELNRIVQSIDNKLSNLSVYGLLDWDTRDNHVRKSLLKQPKFNSRNLLLENRFTDIDGILKSGSRTLEEQFQHAFFVAGLGEWEKAYNLYTDLIRISFNKEQWFIYFFAQLNRYFLSRLILGINRQLISGFSNIALGRTYNMFSTEFIQRVEKETTYQLPRMIFDGMPTEFKQSYSFLIWLCDEVSFSTETSELSKLQFSCSKKIRANSMYMGNDHDFNQLTMRMNDDVRFCYENFLWVYPSSEFKRMIEMALSPLFDNIRKGQNTNNKFSFFGDKIQVNTQEYYIDYYEFIYMVKSFNLKDLQHIFKDIRLKDVRFDDMDKIEQYVIRTLKEFSSISNQGNDGIQVIRYILLSEEIKNILYICSDLKFTEDALTYLVSFILNIAYERDLDTGDRCFYTIKLIMNNKFNKEIIEIIDEFLWKRFELKANEEYKEYTTRSNIYQALARTIKDKKTDYFHERMSEFIINLNNEKLTESQISFTYANMSILSSAAQKIVIDSKKEYSIGSILDLVDLGIIDMLPDYKTEVIKDTERTIEKIKENKRSKITTIPEPTIRYTAILYIVGYLEELELEKYLGVCDEFDMLVDPESFDFESKMDLDWLKYYTPKVLKAIFDNEIFKIRISPVLKASIKETHDKRLVEIFLDYCV